MQMSAMECKNGVASAGVCPTGDKEAAKARGLSMSKSKYLRGVAGFGDRDHT